MGKRKRRGNERENERRSNVWSRLGGYHGNIDEDRMGLHSHGNQLGSNDRGEDRASISRKRHQSRSLSTTGEPDAKRPCPSPVYQHEEIEDIEQSSSRSAYGSPAIDIRDSMTHIYRIATECDEKSFLNECRHIFKAIFTMSKTMTEDQFDNYLQSGSGVDGITNQRKVEILIDKLSRIEEGEIIYLEKSQQDLRQVISLGHLMTDEQFRKLLKLLRRARFSSRSLFCEILQESNFFNSSGVLSNIVHLCRKSRKQRGDSDFLNDMMEILTVYASSRKSGEESALSCLDLIAENLVRLEFDGKEKIKRKLDDVVSKLKDNQLNIHDFEELQSVLNIPMLPTAHMIRENSGPVLAPRERGAPFQSEVQYLCYYFKIFLEDFIGPLRGGINRYINYICNDKASKSFKDDDIRLYKRITVTRKRYLPEFGLVWEIQFDVTSFRKLRWDTCDFLKFGNLVCLTYNDCQDIAYGIVAERSIPDLKSGKTIIKVISEKQDSYGLFSSVDQGQLVMIESKAFYTAYHHTLEEIQNTARRMFHNKLEHVPFSSILAKLQPDVTAPKYMTSEGDSKKLDFKCMLRYGFTLPRTSSHADEISMVTTPPYPTTSPAYGERKYQKPICASGLTENNHFPKATKDLKMYFPVLNPEKWPNASEIGLDRHQYDAFRLALTNSLAVIQGPPGTGKTLLGLRLAEFFLNNFNELRRTGERSPVLLLSYTNHALDQFLEAIMKTESIKTLFCGPKCPFLRMGSRSENDFIKNTSLHSHRVARRMFDSKNMRKDLEVAAKNLDLQLTKLNLFRSGIVHEKYLLETGIISQNTLHQLGWDEREETSILLKFLGVFKQKFLIYDREPTRKQSKQNQSTVPMVVTDANDIDEEFYNEEIWRRTIYEDEFECYSRTECEGSERSIRQLQFGLAEDFPDDFFRYRNLNKDQIFRCINAKLDQTDGFSDQDVEHFLHRPVWSLSHKDRWSLYKNWHLKVREILEENITNMIKTFEVKNKRWKRKNKNEIFDIMMQCKLIAMTTTGAAKYMDILRRVAPRIVIVEEAAQVNEQHILGCLHNDLQHLILIGDHQQLKPTVNNYSLSKDHCTDMSMMERLALNGIPFKRLSEQHRMIPVISDLLKNTIYDELVDHESVLTYEYIRGMAQNVVFFDHRQPESQRSEFTTSYKNDFEANMLAELYRYLRQQGYKSSEITILSTYNEQVRHLRSLVKPIDDYLHNRFGDNEDNIVQDERGCRRILRQGDRRRNRKGVRITAVDNFQGEENIIILLSLVRSNPNAFIGHLRDEKRVCVSLSRAKKGLYVVGNFEILQKKSKQWKTY